MKVQANQINSANLGQVATIDGWGSGILEGAYRENGELILAVAGVEHEMHPTDLVDIRRDAVLGSIYRQEETARERGGVLTDGDMDKLVERILGALGLNQAVAA